MRYRTGMLCGWSLWAVLALAFYAYQVTARKYVPKFLVEGVDVVMAAVGVATWPIGLGGWLFVWGDNGPPEWAQSWLPHIAVGLALWGALGAIVAGLWSRVRRNFRRS